MKRIIAALLLLTGIHSFAQDFSTGYFLKGYTYAYRLNPALRPARGFISLPAISNINVNVGGNVGADSFYFPVSGGKVGSFQHPEVSATDFLSNLPERSILAPNVNLNIFGLGFKAGQAFHTIDIDVRSLNGISASKGLLQYIKEGAAGGITIPEITVDDQTFAEIAYGVSFPVGERLVLGGRLKALVGGAMLQARVTDVTITENGDYETFRAKGHARAALNGLEIGTQTSPSGGATDVIDWEKINLNKFKGSAGLGAAADFGMTFRLTEGIRLSASLSDLGGIRWETPVAAKTTADSWEREISDSFDFEGMFNKFEFHQTGEASIFRMLPMTLRIGAEYSLNEKIGFGALATQRTGLFPLTELRGSVNSFLGNFFGLSASAAVSNFGLSWGAAMNIDAHAFDLFLGFDSIPTRFSTQYIPLGHANIAATLGLSITFGKRVAIR